MLVMNHATNIAGGWLVIWLTGRKQNCETASSIYQVEHPASDFVHLGAGFWAVLHIGLVQDIGRNIQSPSRMRLNKFSLSNFVHGRCGKVSVVDVLAEYNSHNVDINEVGRIIDGHREECRRSKREKGYSVVNS